MEHAIRHFSPFIRIGSEPQPLMAKVVRWSPWPGVRQENVLMHKHSLALVGITAIAQLAPYSGAFSDSTLILTGIAVHDIPEGRLERDIAQPKKTVLDDIEEYLAFLVEIQDQPPLTRAYLEKAFLLQFALYNDARIAAFPRPAQMILRRQQVFNLSDARLFNALEIFDYVRFAVEHRDSHPDLFKVVVAGCAPKLDAYADTIPGFGKELWPQDVSQALQRAARTMV